MMCSRCAALLLCLGSTASAVLVRQGREEERGEAPAAALRARILHRFAEVDADGDGVVSRAEMLRGFGHEPARVGEGLLDGMLAACAGGNASAPCTRQQMESSLNALPCARGAKSERSCLEHDVESFLAPIKGSADGDPCGPSPATSAGNSTTGFEGVVCTVQAARCVRETSLIAWMFTSICADSACICYPTTETKRLVKVGLMGVVAATAAGSFSQPRDPLNAPQCGSAWTSRRIVDRMDGLDRLFTEEARESAIAWLRDTAPQVAGRWALSDYADTEVALFKSSEHALAKDKPRGSVCMFAWQGSRDDGDWKLNHLGDEEPFPYAPPELEAKTHRGHAIVYKHMRDELKRIFEEECCSPDFVAEKLILTGHSRGASLAELHAIDVVTNWQCNGRDLGAKDIAVILFAPSQYIQSSTMINGVFSCSDPTRCLSGSVVTVSTVGDWVADPITKTTACRHPSEVYRVPCMGFFSWINKMYCHVLPRYVKSVESVLVGKEGWGSSCDGACGNPNYAMQCEQVVKATGKSCSEVPSRFLKRSAKVNASCDARWLPGEERCDCDFASCDELTTLGCMGLEVAAPP